jgi:hypothetical protein
VLGKLAERRITGCDGRTRRKQAPTPHIKLFGELKPAQKPDNFGKPVKNDTSMPSGLCNQS